MIGRAVSKYDEDILNALKSKYTDYIKIDFDMLSEPCIFFKYRGPWEMVYKLSATGKYARSMNLYCYQINEAIKEFIKERDQIIAQQKLDEGKVVEEDKQFKKQRDIFKKEGFKDNLPE